MIRGRHSCSPYASRAPRLAVVDAGETGDGRRRIVCVVVGTGERHWTCSRVRDRAIEELARSRVGGEGRVQRSDANAEVFRVC